MSDTSGADDEAQAEMDAAILSHDAGRAFVVSQRLILRRRMAISAYVVMLGGGVALITIGLISDTVAARIVLLASIITTFFVTLASMVMAYWGMGSFDARGISSTLRGAGYSSFSTATTRQRTVAPTASTQAGSDIPQPSSRAD